MLIFQLEGGLKLEQQLRGMAKAVAGKIMGQALRAGAAPILAAARANVPRDTGLLARSLRIVSRRDSAGKVAMMVTAFTTEAQFAANTRRPNRMAAGAFGPNGKLWIRPTNQPYSVFYGGFIEFGHHTGAMGRLRSGSLKRRTARTDRFIAARPYIRPAFDQNLQRAQELIAQTLGDGIDAALIGSGS